MLSQIQSEVAEWANRNFGEQRSKTNGMVLNSLAPLLGIVEENGERYSALTDEQREDAVADTLIYLCDYLAREGVDIDDLPAGRPYISISVAIGQLAHCTLKRHQGIRGFDDPEKYATTRNQACADIIARFGNKYGEIKMLDILTSVWSTVKRRNWVTNPVTAADAG